MRRHAEKSLRHIKLYDLVHLAGQQRNPRLRMHVHTQVESADEARAPLIA